MIKIINFIIYALVFTLPVFFLPFTFEFYAFNKLFLLFFAVSALLILTLWKFIKNNELRIVRTPIDWFLVAFVSFSFISSFFAPARLSAFLGFHGRFSGSFAEIFLFSLFWWLVVQNFGGERAIKTKITALVIPLILISNVLLELFSFFVLFNLGRFFPSSVIVGFIYSLGVSPAGLALQGMAVYSAGISVFLVSVILLSKISSNNDFVKKGWVWLCWILLFVNFAYLILIDFWAAWIIVIVGVGILLGIIIAGRFFRERGNWLSLPLLMAFLSLAFWGFNIHKLLSISISREVLLAFPVSLKTIANAFFANPIFGSGAGNFWYDFNLYKGEEFLSSPFWNIRFMKSHSAFLENISSLGIFGFLAMVAFFAMFFLVSYYLLKKQHSDPLPDVSMGVIPGARRNYYFLLFFIGTSVWFLAGIVYENSVVLSFYLWFFMALAVVEWGEIKPGIIKVSRFDFKKFQEFSVIFLSVFIMFVLAVLAFWWQSSGIYIAEIYYKKALADNITAENRSEYLIKAAESFGFREVYFTTLSRLHLSLAINEVNKGGDAGDGQKLQNSVALAVNAAKRATEISPTSVTVWENSGLVYRDMGSVVENSYIWAEDYFNKAILLEPTNPFLYVNLGRVQMILASVDGKIDNEKMDKAFTNLKKARALKEEYLGVYLNEALALENQGKAEEAIASLEDYFRDFLALGRGVWQDQSELAEFFFQLGRFYYNKDDSDKAIINFVQALNLSPFHANARYSLALILEKQGKKDEAIQHLEVVLELNPGNEALKKKIEELKGE
ncbi:MAG: hypothetical protein US76_04045 [Parcubacteria group bacterium GW2011_GWA2_38_13b]|nr:MAG: hypothetical protein US76_04045 [Parcubacteria group bacterium GW2011_GWA2_38_13b]